jgi:CRISPR system Cascade subunit CasA
MTQAYSFNLVDEPWIPCIKLNGEPITLNLRDVFAQAHQLASIADDSPPINASLHRFLLAILHRVFGPAGEGQWVDLWEAQTWDMATMNAYLEQWHHRFDLFDAERPFYQAPDKRMKPKSIISLRHDHASGNNPTLFDHHTEKGGESLTPAQAARVLLAGQSFGLAGLSGITQKFTDGTCASGILFIVVGENLKQTLMLNLLKYPTDNDQFVHSPDDRPVWEMEDPYNPERTYPLGYLDYLTWQNRRVLLLPEQIEDRIVVRSMTIGPALRYNSDILDPMKCYRKHDKLGPLPIRFSEDRTFWRDSASLFAFREDMREKSIPPTIFEWLRFLVDEMEVPDKARTYSTLALGIAKKQAKVYFFRQEQFPVPLDYLINEDLVAKLVTALDTTGTVAFDLLQSARLMGMCQQLPEVEEKGWHKQWSGLNVNAKTAINNWIDHTGMERNYWASLDIPFGSFIVELAKDQEKTLPDWHTQLRKSVLSAFELAVKSMNEDARAFKAVVMADSYLRYRLNEVIPQVVKEKDI